LIAYDERLRLRLRDNLAAHDRLEVPLDGRRAAAVAIVVVDGDREADGAAFLLCQRTSRLRRHAGQWALPGGRIDPGEMALDAALRELDEELGVRLSPEHVVGWLDDYVSRSGYRITPVVLWGGGDPQLTPSPAEVAAVYRIGLEALADAAPRLIDIPQSDRPVLQLPLGNDLIHAPTAAMLYQFRLVGLEGRAGDRVTGYEEPVFAWR
jgi:8-oxo-dGTP pyrophosphatase MutT (NUDIX family)